MVKRAPNTVAPKDTTTNSYESKPSAKTYSGVKKWMAVIIIASTPCFATPADLQLHVDHP